MSDLVGWHFLRADLRLGYGDGREVKAGETLTDAASYAWTSIAFPMLTGTLITAAGFLPIATAASSTGRVKRSASE